MTEKDRQKLNEKLARHFLGIKKIYYDEWDTEKVHPMYIPSGKPWRTHRIDARPVPNFTDPDYGIAYLFKLIVPNLPKHYTYALYQHNGAWVTEIHDTDALAIADSFGMGAANLAIAFCLAIEKTIP